MLKLNVAKKQYVFTITTNPQILNLIRVLYKLNVIRRFSLNGNKCRIYPTFYKNMFFNVNIKNYSRNTKKVLIKYNTLQILSKSLYNTTLILETSKGLITHKTAIQLKTGGSLICTIF